MSNLLDLRKKGFEGYKVIEKIIFKPRSLKIELLKVFIVIFVVLSVVVGVSNAKDDEIESLTKRFSAIGIVSQVSDSGVLLSDSRNSIEDMNGPLEISTKYLEKVETDKYSPLIISDIKVGDKIIAQGVTDDQTFYAKRVISFGNDTVPLQPIATTTPELASSTIEISPTTDDVESKTESNTSTSSEETSVQSSQTVIETVVEAIQDVVDIVSETVQNVVDVIEGNGEESSNNSNEAPAT